MDLYFSFIQLYNVLQRFLQSILILNNEFQLTASEIIWFQMAVLFSLTAPPRRIKLCPATRAGNSSKVHTFILHLVNYITNLKHKMSHSVSDKKKHI